MLRGLRGASALRALRSTSRYASTSTSKLIETELSPSGVLTISFHNEKKLNAWTQSLMKQMVGERISKSPQKVNKSNALSATEFQDFDQILCSIANEEDPASAAAHHPRLKSIKLGSSSGRRSPAAAQLPQV